MEHLVVYGARREFCGWPANHGMWQWGNEILVGFFRGVHREEAEEHSVDFGQPHRVVLARSVDGGESWRVEAPDTLVDGGGSARDYPGGFDFQAPDLILRCNYADFQVSPDRGRTWDGPFSLPDIGKDLKARTDYIVGANGDCLMFVAAFDPAGGQDRALCLRSDGGGASFEFAAWMTSVPLGHRSVMPSTVQLSNGTLLSALRRRENLDEQVHLSRGPHRCWIDLYGSSDQARTWGRLSTVADTGGHNGNPPALTRLVDGRLCVAYGFRAPPYGIRSRLSNDGGYTWSPEIVLRDDGRTWDLGYPRMVQRSDGKLVTIYYFTTDAFPEQHIAATIWDPDEI